MSWWGKIIGAFFGFLLTGHPIGALFGAFVGHYFDRGFAGMKWQQGSGFQANQASAQQQFFKATFAVMGHVAKADGRVSEREIQHARTIMRRFRFNQQQVKMAIDYFNQGKQPDFNLQATLNDLRQSCHRQRILLKMFVELQFQAAMVDGTINAKKQHILETICQQLGFAPIFADRYSDFFRSAGGQSRAGGYTSSKPSLKNAYQLLEIDESASNADIKRAYRRMMSKHHPDKLIAKGLPEEMIRVATDKSQQIQAAYEQIKATRAF